MNLKYGIKNIPHAGVKPIHEYSVALLAAAALAGYARADMPAPAKAAARPNIIVIMSDEHNASVMGCAGDKIARTPNIDALAAQGVLFSAHYCASPICIPTRQSFTTGKYVSRHNVWGNTVGVPEGTPSLPRVLNAAGYESFLDGKMHYKGGASHGYQVIDEKTGKISPVVSAKDGPSGAVKERKRLPAGIFKPNGAEIGEEFYPIGATDDMDTFVDVQRRDNAIKFLQDRKSDDKPFFLTVGLITPHYPLQAPPEYMEHFKDKIPPPEIPDGYLDSLPLNYKHLRNDRKLEHVPPEMIKLAREGYYARVEWCDNQIGQILAALTNSPLADNTVVIYTSDHGENMGEHGLWWKNCMYDTAARVPLIISWPARWKGGQQRAGACGTLDLVKTLCNLAGTDAPSDWNGSSMLPWLDNPGYAWKDLAVSQFYSGYIASGISMIRQGDWKYVYHARADQNHGPEYELYNMKGDPKELKNLADNPENKQRMLEMHAALIKEIGEDPELSEARWRAGATPEFPNAK